MTVNQFFIPGHATKRDFAIYAVVVKKSVETNGTFMWEKPEITTKVAIL